MSDLRDADDIADLSARAVRLAQECYELRREVRRRAAVVDAAVEWFQRADPLSEEGLRVAVQAHLGRVGKGNE